MAPETPEEGVPGAPPPPPPGGYYSYGQTTTASPAPPPYLPPPEQHRSVTSQWWFWMLMAVAAAVTIGIIYAAAHQSHSTYTTGYMGAGGGRVVLPGHSGHTIRGGLLDRPLLSYPAHAGATLFRF